MKPRARVIIVNDFGGDPDGLFQLTHHLLSPSIQVKGIIGSIQYENGFYGYPGNAQFSSERATELLKVMKMDSKYKVVKGLNAKLANSKTGVESQAARIIINEALKKSDLPLYIVCGAGLTDIANAYLLQPEIADKLTLVWIGGTEYEDLATPPPGASLNWEYNTGIDPLAVQVIFNNSEIPIWQIPRNAYRQALTSYSEILSKVKTQGETGLFLTEKLNDLLQRADKNLGEAYVLGDNPLVLLTALQSSWEVDASSSKYVLKNAPRVNDKGYFNSNPNGKLIRVYDDLDIRLMLNDLYAKLELFSSLNN